MKQVQEREDEWAGNIEETATNRRKEKGQEGQEEARHGGERERGGERRQEGEELDPPLQLQLEPLSKQQMLTRLAAEDELDQASRRRQQQASQQQASQQQQAPSQQQQASPQQQDEEAAEEGEPSGCAGGGDEFISRAQVMSRLLRLYRRRPRQLVPFAGVPVPASLTTALLGALVAMEWPDDHHRPALSSQQYLVLQNHAYHTNRKGRSKTDGSNATGANGTGTRSTNGTGTRSTNGTGTRYTRGGSNEYKISAVATAMDGAESVSTRHAHELQPLPFRKLFGLSQKLMQWADPDFPFTAIAVTKNLHGSPHIDAGDISHQYAISLGSFNTGGQLCVESENHQRVLAVDTHDKLAKIDGRFVHWVRRFDGGDRYSLIFYATTGTRTPRQRAVYTDYQASGGAPHE
jgi:hypothetical protein